MRFDDFLQEACPPLDLEWRKYRRRAARHRIDKRLKELGLEDYAGYLERLRADPGEANGLAEVMLVTVSRFFRERDRWQLLRERVLPKLLENAPRRPLHAWSLGCCGGEEPYSLAVTWLHHLHRRHPAGNLEILATDLDPTSLRRARLGRYGKGSLREVPDDILQRWFRPKNDHWEIALEVRQRVRFAQHNFMRDPLPDGMDLVLARYLPFTYYRGTRRLEAARRLWQALRPGGALMIGRKEGLDPAERELFTPWPGAAGVFRRRP